MIKPLEDVYEDLIRQIRADRQRKQDLWERFISGERCKVSQEIYRLEDVHCDKVGDTQWDIQGTE